jgi:hypothetical protein
MGRRAKYSATGKLRAEYSAAGKLRAEYSATGKLRAEYSATAKLHQRTFNLLWACIFFTSDKFVENLQWSENAK